MPYIYNKEQQKRADDKRKDSPERKEYKKQLQKQPHSIKTRVIRVWKQRGVISNDYNKLYNDYLTTKECQRCEVIMEGRGENKKCLHYCAELNDFKIIVCNVCCWRLSRIYNIMNN